MEVCTLNDSKWLKIFQVNGFREDIDYTFLDVKTIIRLEPIYLYPRDNKEDKTLCTAIHVAKSDSPVFVREHTTHLYETIRGSYEQTT